MDNKFLDNTLRISSTFYEKVCIPLRVSLALLFILNKIHTQYLPYVALVLLFISGGFLRKFYSLPNVWKVYMRAIIIYLFIVGLILFNLIVQPVSGLNSIIGILLLVDVLMGIQSKHIFQLLGSQ